MKQTLVLLSAVTLWFGCQPPKPDIESLKNEILQVEKDFSDRVAEKGISESFLHYAADDAVLMRNNALIVGKDSIRRRFASQSTNGAEVSLTWTPDFVDVSTAGDLGYTYGKYVYSVTDSTGAVRKNEGVFHTVWKKQTDGSWKFVWD